MIKYLVEQGTYVNKENIIGEIPLFIVCDKEFENIVKYLVKHNTNVNKITSFLLH